MRANQRAGVVGGVVIYLPLKSPPEPARVLQLQVSVKRGFQRESNPLQIDLFSIALPNELWMVVMNRGVEPMWQALYACAYPLS